MNHTSIKNNFVYKPSVRFGSAIKQNVIKRDSNIFSFPNQFLIITICDKIIIISAK